MSNMFCQECGEEVPKNSKFCCYCRFPFTKEAEAKLAQIKNKPKVRTPEPEEIDEDENDEIQESKINIENKEVFGFEVERESGGLQRFTFQELINSPKEDFIPRPKGKKMSNAAFKKQWATEAGNAPRIGGSEE